MYKSYNVLVVLMQAHTYWHVYALVMHQVMSCYSNTVSRSGVFCALVNAIEFCKTESVVDIFEVVKAIRIQKPGAVETVVSTDPSCVAMNFHYCIHYYIH